MSKLLCSLLGGLLWQALLPALADAPGVWQKHEYTFQFMGFTSTYSCDGLADKLELLLMAAGARADAKARPGACAASFGQPDKFARADLVFYTLSSAPAAGADAAVRADGMWKAVTFAPLHPFDLAVGDCELVEQFASRILPMFQTRHIDSHVTCIPNQDSGSVIDLKFDSFVAAPKRNGA